MATNIDDLNKAVNSVKSAFGDISQFLEGFDVEANRGNMSDEQVKEVEAQFEKAKKESLSGFKSCNNIVDTSNL